MTKFTIHTPETAPEDSKTIVETAQKKYGFVPNLIGIMAEAPAAVEAYLALNDIFDKTSFSAAEKQVILLSASYVNQCTYCMAAHTAIAGMNGVPEEVIEALRQGRTLPDGKLDALARLTRSVVETRGWPEESAKQAFFEAGYDPRHYLELLVGVTMKTLSNYVNHVAETPLDDAFRPAEWSA